MDKSSHEEHLSQPLQTNNKQFKLALTFLTGYKGIFNVTNENIKFYFSKSIQDDDFNQLSFSPGAYDIESLDKEIIRIILQEGHFIKSTYPFKIKLNFSTLGSFIEISSNITSSQIAFTPGDRIIDLLGFKPVALYEKYNLSTNPSNILSFNNMFIECDFARGMTYRGKRSNILHYWTMTVDLGYKNVERFAGAILLGI